MDVLVYRRLRSERILRKERKLVDERMERVLTLDRIEGGLEGGSGGSDEVDAVGKSELSDTRFSRLRD